MWVNRQKIQVNEPVAARRTVDIYLWKTSGAPYLEPYNTVLTEKKLKMSKNGEAVADSTADVLIEDATWLPGLYRLILTVAEVSDLGKLYVSGKVSDTLVNGATIVDIVDYDPTTEGAVSDEELKSRRVRP